MILTQLYNFIFDLQNCFILLIDRNFLVSKYNVTILDNFYQY